MPKLLKIASTVTPEHGRLFAAEWIRRQLDMDGFFAGLTRTALVEWPGDEDLERWRRYNDIGEAIHQRMLEVLQGPIAEAFVQAATEVLDAERGRALRV